MNQQSIMPSNRHHQLMQWFVLIVLCIALLASLAFGAVGMYITKSPLPLAIPSSFVYLMRQIIKFLFRT